MFCLPCFVYLFVWLSWYAWWDLPLALQSHLWKKQYVWVHYVYGKFIHWQVERGHSQILESKTFSSGLSIPLGKNGSFYAWGIDAWLPDAVPHLLLLSSAVAGGLNSRSSPWSCKTDLLPPSWAPLVCPLHEGFFSPAALITSLAAVLHLPETS